MKIRDVSLVFLLAACLAGSTAAEESPVIAKHSIPQPQVVCTGRHALCSFADDCVVDKNNPWLANCACWEVSEPHIVSTADIKDQAFGGLPIKKMTQRLCTVDHPCNVDEAPVCMAIKRLLQNQRRAYNWVSTYSYRGWCENWEPVACGNKNSPWADCMSSPCREVAPGTDRPLNCRCDVLTGPFVGTRGSCDAGKGKVMSTIKQEMWDFDHNTYRIPPSGFEYVNSACSSLGSD
jgi:hypothetical protein